MKILLTNDDGIISTGIQMMSRLLSDRGWLSSVIAPDRERSGTGHSITLGNPVRVHPLDPGMFSSGVSAYSCDGTPTDCVNIGLDLLFPQTDFVVSGINQGPNMGDDVTYSGTVCAAMEGVILGRPSIAVSLACDHSSSFRYNMTAALAAMSVIACAERVGLPEGTLLNVNVPNELIRNIKGFKLTRRGTRIYRDKFTAIKDPHGKDCYWIGGRIEDKHEEGTDVAAVAEGYVSVTPIHIDMTHYALLDEMIDRNIAAELDETLRATGK